MSDGRCVMGDQRELEMRRKYMHNLPFCPDHRDKVKGKLCRECEIERLRWIVNRTIDELDSEMARCDIVNLREQLLQNMEELRLASPY